MSAEEGSSKGTATLEPGAMVDHYRIIRPLGAGGMAEVYLARDTKLGRKVALKIIQPKRIGKKDFVERFLFEAKTTAKFSHPHIIAIHGVGETNSGPYLALEYLEGQTLRERLEQERLSVREAIRIGKEIADALSTAHAKNLIHRDLKPENVMLGRDGRLRVLDFGLSCLLGADDPFDQEGEDDSLSGQPFVSKNQGRRGTPAYMAPEQWKAEEIGPAVDVWALGLVLYEMLLGYHPYENVMSLRTLATQITSLKPVPIPTSQNHVPPALLTLLKSCLEKEACDRPTAQDVYQELAQQLTPDQPGHLTAKNPFRGLLSFEEEHSSLYFGREAEVDAFVENLRYEPVLPVVGPSGAGKSSFIKAGVIPRLREKAPVILVQVRPGQDPFLSLASNLISAWRRPTHATGSLGLMGSILGLQKANAEALESFENPNDLSQDLFNRPHQLGLLLHQLAEQNRAHVVLFVDQLEELCAVEGQEGVFPESSEGTGLEPTGGVLDRFMQAIAGAADDPKIPVRVIVTMREEFLTRLLTGSQVRKALNRITVLRKPGQKTLVDILERTVKAVGYKFEEFHLPYELVDDVKAAQTCFPLLQFACQVMWQNRDENRKVLTRKAYQEMGGVTGSLVQHAEGVLAGLTTQEVTLAKKILLRLVTEDKTRRIVSQKNLLLGLQSETQGVLERLVESRLMTISRKKEGEEGECELVHEALVSNWERLNNWIDESREEIGLLRQLEQAARLWDKRGRRVDELWSKQALKESAVVLEQAISQGTVNADFVASSERQISKGRIRIGLVFGFLGFALVASAWIGNNFLLGKVCTGAEEEVAAVWNPEVRKTIGKAFLGTGVSYAKDTVDRVYKLLDRYSNEWAAHYTKACEATHVRGEQSDEVLDLRMSCLRKRKGEFGALVKVFKGADAGVVQKSVQAGSSLNSVSLCADEKALRASYPQPKTISKKAKVAIIREKLSEVEALINTGKYKDGLKLARRLEKEAKALAYRPVQAEVLYWLGQLFEKTGEHEKSENALRVATRFAGESRDALLAAKAMAWLVWVVGHVQAKFEAGLSIAQDAAAMLGVAGGDERTRASLLNKIGGVYTEMGDLDNALEYYRKSLAIWENVIGSVHPGVAAVVNNIGVLLADQRQYEKAFEYHQRALALRKKALGPNHPDVAMSLNNIGNLFSDQGDHDKALEYLQKALVIRESALGTEHPIVASSLYKIGQVLKKQGKYDKSLEYLRKAFAILEKSLGSENRYVASSLSGIGNVLVEQGSPKNAIEPLERAIAICDRKTCEIESHGQSLFALTRALVATGGDKQRVIKLAKQAREVFEKKPKAFKKELKEINTWLQKHSTSKLAKKDNAHK